VNILEQIERDLKHLSLKKLLVENLKSVPEQIVIIDGGIPLIKYTASSIDSGYNLTDQFKRLQIYYADKEVVVMDDDYDFCKPTIRFDIVYIVDINKVVNEYIVFFAVVAGIVCKVKIKMPKSYKVIPNKEKKYEIKHESVDYENKIQINYYGGATTFICFDDEKTSIKEYGFDGRISLKLTC